MSYANPQTITLNFGLIDFPGGSADTFSFKLPKGKVGKLRDVLVSATETFNGSVSKAFVNIGSAESGKQYAECDLGTTADKASYQLSNNPTHLVEADLPKDTDIWVAFVANVDAGTETGTGFVSIVIDVF